VSDAGSTANFHLSTVHQGQPAQTKQDVLGTELSKVCVLKRHLYIRNPEK